mgnify:FL=1
MTENRPLSPHLSIHKRILTALFSIFHRFTGISLSIGSIFISFWIATIALGPKYFSLFEYISSMTLFKIILFAWTIGIFYHLFNGIRYLFWSYGMGMDIKTVYNTGYLVLFLTLISTLCVWFVL